jgi:hypothetical protein
MNYNQKNEKNEKKYFSSFSAIRDGTLCSRAELFKKRTWFTIGK